MIRRSSCPSCELSIEAFCRYQPIPAKLCGLCALVSHEALERYFAKWKAGIGKDRGRAA